jgi:hypothetical protein
MRNAKCKIKNTVGEGIGAGTCAHVSPSLQTCGFPLPPLRGERPPQRPPLRIAIYLLATVFLFALFTSYTSCASTYPERGTAADNHKRKRLGIWTEQEAFDIAKRVSQRLERTPQFLDYIMELDKAPSIVVGSLHGQTDDGVDVDLMEEMLTRTIGKTGKAVTMHETNTKVFMPAEVLSYHHTFEEEAALEYLENTEYDMLLTGRVVTNLLKINLRVVRAYHVYIELYDAKTLKLIWQTSDHRLRKIVHGKVRKDFLKKYNGERRSVGNKKGTY